MAYSKTLRQRLLSLSYGLDEHTFSSGETTPTPLGEVIARYMRQGLLLEPEARYPGAPGYDASLGDALGVLTSGEDGGVRANYVMRVADGSSRADIERFASDVDAVIDTLPRQKISPALASWYQDEKRGGVYRERIDRIPAAPFLDVSSGQTVPMLIVPDQHSLDLTRTGLERLADDLRVTLPTQLYRGQFRDQLMDVVRQSGGFRDQQMGERVAIWTAEPQTKRALQSLIDDYRIAKMGPQVKTNLAKYLQQGFARSFFEQRRERQLSTLEAQREALGLLDVDSQLIIDTREELEHRKELLAKTPEGPQREIEQRAIQYVTELSENGLHRIAMGVNLAERDAVVYFSGILPAHQAMESGELLFRNSPTYETELYQRLERRNALEQQIESVSLALTPADFANEKRVAALINGLSADELDRAHHQARTEISLAQNVLSDGAAREKTIIELAQRICFDDAWEFTRNFLADAEYARAQELRTQRGNKGRVEQPSVFFSRQPPYDRVLEALQSMNDKQLTALVDEARVNAERARKPISIVVERSREQMLRELRQRLREGKGNTLRGSLQRNLDTIRKESINTDDLINAALSENETIAREAFSGKTVRGVRDAYAEDLTLDEYRTFLSQGYISHARSMHDLRLREATIRAITAVAHRNENGALELPRLTMLERQQQPAFLADLPGRLAPGTLSRFSGTPVAIYGLNERGFVQRFSALRPREDQDPSDWNPRNPAMQSPLIAVLEQGEPRLTATNAFSAMGLAVRHAGDAWLHGALTSAFVERYGEIVREHQDDRAAARAALHAEFDKIIELFNPEDRETLQKAFEVKPITARHRLARAFGQNLYQLLYAQDVRDVGRQAIENAFTARYQEIVGQHETEPELVNGALLSEFGAMIDLLPEQQRANLRKEMTASPRPELAYAMAETLYKRLHNGDADMAESTITALPQSLRYVSGREPLVVQNTFTALPDSLRRKVSANIVSLLEEKDPSAVRGLYQPTGRYAVVDLASVGHGRILSAVRDNNVADRPIFDYKPHATWGDRDAFIAYDYDTLIDQVFASAHLALPVDVSLDQNTQQVRLQLFNGASKLKADRAIAEHVRYNGPRDRIDGLVAGADPQLVSFLDVVQTRLRDGGHGIYNFTYRPDDAPEVFKSKESLKRESDMERALDGRSEGLDGEDGEVGSAEHAQGITAGQNPEAMAAAIAEFAAEQGIDVYSRHIPLFDDARITEAQKSGVAISNVVVGVRARLDDRGFEGHCLASMPHGYTAIIGKTADGRDQLSMLATDQLGGPLREGGFYRISPDLDNEWVPTMLPGRESNHLMHVVGEQHRGIVTPERRAMIDLAIASHLSTENAERGLPTILDANSINKVQQAQGGIGLPVRTTATVLMVDTNRRFGIGYNEQDHTLVPLFLDDMPSMIARGDSVTVDLRAENGVVRTDMARVASRFNARSSEWQEAIDLGMDAISKHEIGERLGVPTAWLEEFRPAQNVAFQMQPVLATNDRTYFARQRAENADRWQVFSIPTYGPLHADPNESGVDAKDLTDDQRKSLVNDLRAFGHDPANGIQFSDMAASMGKREEISHVLETGYAEFILRGTRLEMRPIELPPDERSRRLALKIREMPGLLFEHGPTVGRRTLNGNEPNPGVPSLDGPANHLGQTERDVVFGVAEQTDGPVVKMYVFPLEKDLIQEGADLDLAPFEPVLLQANDDRYTIERQEAAQSKEHQQTQTRLPSA